MCIRDRIAAAQALRQFLEPGAAAVVEHPDAIIAVVHPGRADDGALEDGLFLVVGADPVSYTHLDVYKRQGYMSHQRIPKGPRSAWTRLQ